MWCLCCFYKFCFVPPFCFKFHLAPLSRDNISSQIHFFKCKQTETMKISNTFVHGKYFESLESELYTRFCYQSYNRSFYKIHRQKRFIIFDISVTFALHINILVRTLCIYSFLNLFWISMSLTWKIWAGCSRLSANIGRFSNLAFLTQILHFVFVSGIFAVCLLANLNIIPQSGGRGGKIAVGDSKQQLDNRNTNYKIDKLIITQSGGRGGKMAVSESKSQLNKTNTNQ